MAAVEGAFEGDNQLRRFFEGISTTIGQINHAERNQDLLLIQHVANELRSQLDFLLAIEALLYVPVEAEADMTTYLSNRHRHHFFQSILIQLTNEVHFQLCAADELSETSGNLSMASPDLESNSGRPRYKISAQYLTSLLETGMTWSAKARCLGISERMVLRRRDKYNINYHFLSINDEVLDVAIDDTLPLTPGGGEVYAIVGLRRRSLKIQRDKGAFSDIRSH